MAAFDLPIEQLRTYRPELALPPDLEPFWQDTIAQARTHEPLISIEQVDNRLSVIDTYDLVFAGFDGQPIRAWLHVPAGAEGPLPTVAHYIGYSWGRGFPFRETLYAQAGYAQLSMDTRGQSYSGGGWQATPDVVPNGVLPSQAPGQLTRGISDPATHYYRRAYTDAVRLLDLAAVLPQCDETALVTVGGSQGGAFSIAAASLAGMTDTQVAGTVAFVPFLCNIARAIAIVDSNPYHEIVQYLAAFRDQVEPAMRTLSYFDGAVLSRFAQSPTLFTTALRDATCPPSTCFAAFNWWGANAGAENQAAVADKHIEVYQFNGHEGGGDYQVELALDWLRTRLGAAGG